MAALKYWVWLASRPGVRTYTLNRLIDWFGSPEQVFYSDDATYGEIPGLLKQEVAALSEKNLCAARKTLNDCEEYGYRIMTLHDGDYPSRLKNIHDSPVVLYIKGRLPVIDEEAAVAIVGTRKCTPYGIKSAERIAYELVRHGCIVVSGLARGIDSAAAKGALRAGGSIVGVVGSGLDITYPPENKKLFDDVALTGAIISEYPPGSPAASSHFPRRNRIISGLSVGVTVIEAPCKSGALITAAHALEQGRDVFALPGNIDSPACKGSNQLLREGAVLITSGREIAEEYAALFPEKIVTFREKVPLDSVLEKRLITESAALNQEKTVKKGIDNQKTMEYIDLVKLKDQLDEDAFRILSSIGPRVLHIDEIITQSGLNASVVLPALTMLELDGYVEQMAGKYFRLLYEHSRI